MSRALHPSVVKTDEWLEARRKGIGGSDWVSLMAIVDEEKYKYGCQRRIYYDKKGITPDFPVIVTAAMERGLALEPVITEMFYANNPGAVPVPYHQWPKRVKYILKGGVLLPDWWIGNADDVFKENELSVLETKTMNQNVFFTAAEEGLSDGYTMQPLHYMAMLGIREGAVACLWPDGWGYFDLAAVWDSSTIEAMLNAGDLFWNKVMKSNKPPDRPLPTDDRCGKCPFRLSCLGKGYYEEHVLKIQDLSSDDSLEDLFKLYHDAMKRESASGKEKEAAKRKILKYLESNHGDAEHVICRGFELQAGKKVKRKLDYSKLESHHPKVMADITEEVPDRSFKLQKKSSLQEAWENKTL